jgi:hypothetical protein
VDSTDNEIDSKCFKKENKLMATFELEVKRKFPADKE